MSPRPRRLADAELIQIAAQVVAERGAEQTRFVDVAVASGLAPATLVQRFGTRDRMLDAVRGALTAAVIAAFGTRHSSPLDRLKAGLTTVAEGAHLSFLLTRSDGGASYSLEVRKQIAYCLAAAMEENELPHCDIAALARRLQLGFYGLLTAAQLEHSRVTDTEIAELVDWHVWC